MIQNFFVYWLGPDLATILGIVFFLIFFLFLIIWLVKKYKPLDTNQEN